MTALTRQELLVLLIEECAEVTKAVTKCQRFGWNRNHPGYGQNDLVLSSEIGDLLGVIDGLGEYLNISTIRHHRARKIAKAERAKEEFGAENY